MAEGTATKQYNVEGPENEDKLSADETAVQSISANRPNDLAMLLSGNQSSFQVYNDIKLHERHEAESASGLKRFQFTRTVKANGIELSGKPDCEVQGKTVPLINGVSLDLAPAHLKMHAGFLDFQKAYVQSEDESGGDLYVFFPGFGTILQAQVDETLVSNYKIVAQTNTDKLYNMNNANDKYSMYVNGYVQDGDKESGVLKLSKLSMQTKIGEDELLLNNIVDTFEYNNQGLCLADGQAGSNQLDMSGVKNCLHITPLVDIVKPKVTIGKKGLQDLCVTGEFKLNDDLSFGEQNASTEVSMIKSGTGGFVMQPISLEKLDIVLNGYKYQVYNPQTFDGKRFIFDRAVFQNKLFKDTEINGGAFDEKGLASDVWIDSENSVEKFASSSKTKDSGKENKSFLNATDDGIVKIKFPKYEFENIHNKDKIESGIKGTGYISVEDLKVKIVDPNKNKDTVYTLDDMKPDPNDKIEFTADGSGRISTEIGDLEGDVKNHSKLHAIVKDTKLEDGKLNASTIKLDTTNEMTSEMDYGDNSAISGGEKDFLDKYVPFNVEAGIRRHYLVSGYEDGTLDTVYQKKGIGKIEIGALGDHVGASLDVDEGKYELSLSSQTGTDEDKGSLSIFDSSKWKSGANVDIPLLGPLTLSFGVSGSAKLAYGLKAGFEVGGKQKGDKTKGVLSGEISAPMEACAEFGFGLGIANVASVYANLNAKLEVEPKFTVTANTEVEIVEDKKKPGKLKPQFTGDIRIDLHGEAVPTFALGISAGVKFLIWKGQLYSVTLCKKELANLQFNKGIVRKKDGTWDFKDSEFTIDFLGKSVYELARNNDAGIFETKKENFYYNLSEADGNSFENALAYLNEMRAFRKGNEFIYDKEEFGLAMKGGIEVRKKFVSETRILEKELRAKETAYNKMMANNAVLKLSHMDDMMRHEDNMRIIAQTLNGMKSDNKKLSDVLAEIRENTGFDAYNVYAKNGSLGGKYKEQIQTTDLFRAVDEETEDKQFAAQKKNPLWLSEDESIQDLDYEQLKFFYQNNLMHKGRQSDFQYLSEKEYQSVSHYRQNDMLLEYARQMLYGDSSCYKANISGIFGENSAQMQEFENGRMYFESHENQMHREGDSDQIVDDETYVANELAQAIRKKKVQGKLAKLLGDEKKKNSDKRIEYARSLTGSLASREVYDGVKSRFKEAIGANSMGHMATDVITRYRKETQRATTYRKYFISLDSVAKTASGYNANLKLQIECCKLIADNAELVLNSNDLMSQKNDRSVDIALAKSREFKEQYGTESILQIASQTKDKCKEYIDSFNKQISMFDEARNEIEAIKESEDEEIWKQ